MVWRRVWWYKLYSISLAMMRDFKMDLLKIFLYTINIIVFIEFANSTISLENSRISYQDRILPTPNVIPYINQAVNPNAPKQEYTLTLEEVKEIKLSCQSAVPNRWIWNNLQLYVSSQHVDKKRDELYFSSNLTAALNTEEIEANFSCSNEVEGLSKKAPHVHVVTCVYIRQELDSRYQDSLNNQDQIVMRIVKNVPIDNCVERPIERSSTCPTTLEVDVENRKGICKKGGANHDKEDLQSHSCNDIDSCRALIHAKSVTEQCYGVIHSSSPGTLSATFNLEPYPVVVYCAKSDKASLSRGDWTTSILLYPTFAENNMKTLKYYSNFTEALMQNSIKIIALSNDPFIRQIQLETMTGRTEFAEGESVELVCKSMMFLYMKGFQIRIQKMSQESAIVMDKTKQIYEIHREEHFHLIKQNVTLSQKKYGNITRLSCAGPPWNSEQWAISTINVKITSAEAPFANLSYLITANNSIEFTCTYGGWPRPLVNLEFSEPVTIINESGHAPINENWSKNWTEVKTIKSQTFKSLKAVCNVENFKGNASNSTEFINSTGNSKGLDTKVVLLAVFCSLTVCVIATVVILIFYWKYRKGLKLYSQQPRLTIEEIEEFYSGATQPSETYYEALQQPYNEDYEIKMNQLELGPVLGSGQFGYVLRGTIGPLTVAVKTVKPTADVIYLRSLLSELKILQFVGVHRNIVNLIGANTTNIKKREVYLILDYCLNGNLVNFLRECRERFVDCFGNSYQSKEQWPLYENSKDVILSTANLITFSYEIASAMDHLASKNVIHGDLAARNVLVTEDLHAKVCDFGLAKQLLHYSVYVQKVNCPLPLRWMAIESLQDMEFSLGSDRWSYGICLWEIFSMAELPYAGMQWGFDSYKMLMDGYRMQRPNFSNQTIYNLMMQCWEKDPQERPSYKYLMTKLKMEEDALT